MLRAARTPHAPRFTIGRDPRGAARRRVARRSRWKRRPGDRPEGGADHEETVAGSRREIPVLGGRMVAECGRKVRGMSFDTLVLKSPMICWSLVLGLGGWDRKRDRRWKWAKEVEVGFILKILPDGAQVRSDENETVLHRIWQSVPRAILGPSEDH